MDKTLYKPLEEKISWGEGDKSDILFSNEQLSLYNVLEVPEITSFLSPSERKTRVFRLPTLETSITKKEIDHSWDFQGANTKTCTHCFHNYPAVMIPQVARRLINEYAKKNAVVLDPFCGSGTVLVEAKLQGLKSFGVDINPLATLVAKVKTTPIKIEILERSLNILVERTVVISDKETTTPKFFNIDFWFKPEVIQELTRIRQCIEEIDNGDIKDFFRVVFSETVREVSNTRNSEFKLYRVPEKKLISFNPNVLEIFVKKAHRNIQGMSEFLSECRNLKVEVSVCNEDIRFATSIPTDIADIIVTSPPYGDSKTTVAYGQFSRLSLQWLGFTGDDLATDIKSLGGCKSIPISYYKFESSSLVRVLYLLAEKDKKRAREVLNFFLDYKECLKEIDRILKVGGYICMVLGNRTVKETPIPMDEITTEFGNTIGWHHIRTIIRSIPSKRMPKRNSPTNIRGQTASTINSEYIVIMQKGEQSEF